jgi:hypothetical protein
MPFCPKCRYEYKPEIWECPDCGVRLVEKLEEKESSENREKSTDGKTNIESTESLKFVPLRDIPSRIQADMLRGLLENAGIPSQIRGLTSQGYIMTYFSSPLGGVTLWVPEKDLVRAKEIADQMLDQI